jgi:hypothetical protein
VKVKTTVEDLIGAAINAGITRHEATMTIYDMLSEFISDEDRAVIMGQIEELV